MSALHDPRIAAPPLLEMALGLRRTIARLDALLERYAPAGGATELDADDDWTWIVLGAIALRDRLDRELTRSAARACEPATEPGGAAASLLR